MARKDAERNRAKLVEAVAMVGMIVGPDHRVQTVEAGVQRLLAKIRAGVDEDVGAFVADQDRSPAAAVARLAGIAAAPIIADPGHAERGSAAQEPKLHAAAF